MDNMEQLVTKTYLKNTSLKLLENWSVQYLLESKFSYNDNFELMPISSFLIKSRLRILIEDDKTYQRVTVKINNNGVIPRDTEIGKNIGTKQQYLVKTGQFLMSKIDARNGAFGLVPKILDGAIVTNDFPVFDVDKTVINPEFLVLITTTKEFIKFAQSCSSGTTNRQRIDIDLFLNVKIPLPSLSEQNRIIDAYNKKIKLAEDQEIKAKELEEGIEEYLFEKLGIEKISESKRNKRFYKINYQEIERWDVWVNLGDVKSKKYKNTIFNTVVIGKPEYGANVKGVKKKSDTRYIRITDINEAGYLNEEFVSPASVDDRFLLRENDFLIARSGNTVGKTLLFKEEFGRAIYAGYLVKYNIDFSLVIPEYLFLFTKSYPFKKWIESNQRVSGQPNINGQEFLQAPLILPPIEIQNEIYLNIEERKSELQYLKQNAVKNRESAIKEFENEIFKPCN